jgi:outer membrane immunogenic protein
MKIRRFLSSLLLAAVVICAQTALAADIAPSFNWTGPYAGLHFGYGRGNGDTNFSAPDPGFGDLAPSTLSPNPDGVLGGLQAGYNYQVGCFVFGIEADFSGSAMSGNKTSSPIFDQTRTPFPNTTLSAGESINWYGTLRPRVGYTLGPSTLVYATGGLAYGNVSYSAYTDYRPVLGSVYPSSFSSTMVGWAVGGGIEYAFAGCWTVNAQYLHIDLGDQSTAAAGLPQTGFEVEYKWRTAADIVSVGINHKF